MGTPALRHSGVRAGLFWSWRSLSCSPVEASNIRVELGGKISYQFGKNVMAVLADQVPPLRTAEPITSFLKGVSRDELELVLCGLDKILPAKNSEGCALFRLILQLRGCICASCANSRDTSKRRCPDNL